MYILIQKCIFAKQLSFPAQTFSSWKSVPTATSTDAIRYLKLEKSNAQGLVNCVQHRFIQHCFKFTHRTEQDQI